MDLIQLSYPLNMLYDRFETQVKRKITDMPRAQFSELYDFRDPRL